MYSFLYNKSAEADLVVLLTYINDFTKGLGECEVTVDPDKCLAILRAVRQSFPHKDGLDKASVFKKLAYFLCFFLAERPIETPFSEPNISSELAAMENHQNAMVALNLAIDSLHGSTVRENTGSELILNNRIPLSKHSYIDIVDAIRSSIPSTHFKIMTVFLEQLAYKANPDCQYDFIEI